MFRQRPFIGIAYIGAISLAACSGGSTTFAPGKIAPTAAPGATATPTSVPSGAPTATPTTVPTTSAIALSPNSLAFEANPNNACGNAAMSFTASETGFSGTFSATAADPTLVTVTPSSTSAFAVTPSSTTKSSTQTTSVTVTDGRGNASTVAITFNAICLP